MLYISNTFFEHELDGRKLSSLKNALHKNSISFLLQYLPLLFLKSEDGVLVSEMPKEKYLEFLKSMGINPLPHLVTFESGSFSKWKEVKSWGSSDLIEAWAKEQNLPYNMPSQEIAKKINSKVWNFHKTPHLPFACSVGDKNELEKGLQVGENEGVEKWVLKTEQGFSGSGHMVFSRPDFDKALRFCHLEWSKGNSLLLEPWVERVLDFSSQWIVTKEGHKLCLGVTKILNNPFGIYQGTEVGAKELLFKEFQKEVENHLEQCEKHLDLIIKQNYFGNIGFDAMIYKCLRTGRPLLHPIVEVNARMTMSCALLLFHQRYIKNKTSIFKLITPQKEEKGLLPTNSKKQLIICS